MRKLSTGDDSTLGSYLKLSKQILGERSGAVEFLNVKIAEAPNGENEEVIADEGQMVYLLASMLATNEINTEEGLETLKPIQNHLNAGASLEGRLFGLRGDELEFVQSYDDAHVWTYCETDGVLHLASGYHLVNRLGYIVTELPYVGPPADIVLDDGSDAD